MIFRHSGTVDAMDDWRPVGDAVLIVRARISDAPLSDDDLKALLPDSDRQRIARLRRPEDRARSQTGIGLVRRLLGRWHGVPPIDLVIERTSNGKPWVSGGTAFSIAHAGDRVVVAFAERGRLGIDVEQINDDLDFDGIAARCWHAEESAVWARVPERQRSVWFYRHWTAKEAVVKALGAGVDTMPLVWCDSWSAPEEPRALSRVRQVPGDMKADKWSLVLSAEDNGYPLALAWDRPARQVRVVDV